MKSGPQKRRRLLALWERDSRCHWCRQPTVLAFRPSETQHKKFPPRRDEATIDHLFSRLSAERGLRQGVEVTVLACWECNNRRCQEEQAAVPIEELRRRARNNGRVMM